MAFQPEMVVVVHGFAGKRFWMRWMAARLCKRYQVLNWGYNSFAGSIENHADDLREVLQKQAGEKKLHIVAHSMGSIVVRTAIQNNGEGMISNLGRIVLLAPPNHGTPIARLASPVIGSFCRPVSELSSSAKSYVNSLSPEINCSTGIVAGKFDLLVPPRYTKLSSADDYIETVATHNSMLLSKRTAMLAMQFLEHGSFQTSS